MNVTPELLQLIRAIGRGFHGETRGDEYTSLPEGYSPERVDQILDTAWALGVDVNAVALEVLEVDQWQ